MLDEPNQEAIKLREAHLRDVRRRAQIMAADLILFKGLYSSIDTSDEVAAEAAKMIRGGTVGTFDCYCTVCQRETSFTITPSVVQNSGGGSRIGRPQKGEPLVFAVRAVCQRDNNSYDYAFAYVDKKFTKIGQFPSMGDISFKELKGIDKGLEPLDRKELGTAIGLFSHDAASGAFVYLRRVFERMINRAYDRHVERSGVIAGFRDLHMNQRIAALKDDLPDRLVQHSAVFRVLSAGIHELTDEQCLTLFPVVKAIVFQMLEQEEHLRRKAKAEKDADEAFQILLSSDLFKKEEEDAHQPKQ